MDWAYQATATLLVQGRSYWLSVVGMILTICGFAMTYWQLRKTRHATEAVNAEVKRIKFSLTRYDASIETTKAEQALRTVDASMRGGEWSQVGEHVSAVTKSIHILLELNVPEFAPHIENLKGALSHTRRLSERIDEAGPNGLPKAEKIKALSTLREHGRTLDSVRIALDRSNIGE